MNIHFLNLHFNFNILKEKRFFKNMKILIFNNFTLVLIYIFIKYFHFNL